MTINSALITGIGGQDGAYLAQFLVRKGYRVCGFDIAGNSLQTPPDCRSVRSQVKLCDGDVSDPEFMRQIIARCEPTEVYHLASHSHVGDSFNSEDEVESTNFGGARVVLDAIAELPANVRPRVYNACSSEVFGPAADPVTEETPFNPVSPYAKSKAQAYEYGKTLRETKGLHVSHGFMFNHESPLRTDNFVSRKVTKAAARAGQGVVASTAMGNLNASRDWGHAWDYVEAMWLMLQRPTPDDFVIASGVSRCVRNFANAAFEEVGITLKWRGQGVGEAAYDALTGAKLIYVDPDFLRPTDSDMPCGNTAKAKRILGWEPRIEFKALVAEMVMSDVRHLETKVLAQA